MFKKFILPIFILISVSAAAIYFTPYLRQLLLNTGLIQEQISIAGTGSMYPTFPKGEGATDIVNAQETVAWPKMQRYPTGINWFGLPFFTYKLQHGDIVEFDNEKTKQISQDKYGSEAGFVKRVVGIASDSISVRDGFVILNGQILNEPYTAKPRSTYGGEFLADCQSLTVPPDSVFVLGDNRKASLDSRFELGLVKLSDIHYVLPWNKQENFKKSFRDTSNDLTFAHTVTLDSVQFVNLLNSKRQEKKLVPFKYNPLLSSSSQIRGNAMIKSNDFSTQATRSGVTLAKAVREAGYNNIIFAEVFTRGFYETGELLENFLEFPETQKLLYSSEYQDVGLSAVLGEIAGCPTQVIVVHFGGFIPPNYSSDEIASWSKLISNIDSVLPSWRALRQVEGIDQDKLSLLLNSLETRLSHAQKIYARMQGNQWLNNEEEIWVEDDKRLSEEANRLIGELKK